MSSKLCLCHYKGDLPTAERRGGKAAVLLRKRVTGSLRYPDNPVTMTQRTKYFQLRLTEEEYTDLKEKSASHASVSQYIRAAVTEYSNINVKQKLRLLSELGCYYRKFQSDLSHIGGNLNQSVKRANELSVAGLLPPSYISEVLMPEITRTKELLETLKRELHIVTKSATKV